MNMKTTSSSVKHMCLTELDWFELQMKYYGVFGAKRQWLKWKCYQEMFWKRKFRKKRACKLKTKHLFNNIRFECPKKRNENPPKKPRMWSCKHWCYLHWIYHSKSPWRIRASSYTSYININFTEIFITTKHTRMDQKYSICTFFGGHQWNLCIFTKSGDWRGFSSKFERYPVP